jgi:surface antigen
MSQWNASKKLRVVGTPERGDIFIMDFGGGKGHTGFVAEIKGDRIMTIEGNSNGQGSREGVEVCGKPNGRPMRSILGYIRLS